MFDSKRDALIAEGLSEAEADYLISGGTKTDGLELSASTDDGSTATTTADHAPQRGARQDSGSADRDAELRDLREKNVRMDERMRLFHEAFAQPEAQPQPRQKPDRESNPFEYMAWLEEQVDGLRQSSERTRAQEQERDAVVELTNTFRNDAVQYARTNPDFWESTRGAGDGAYHFLMKNRDAELAAAGYLDPAERARIIAADERDIVARAFHARQRNASAPGPAEVLFNLAVARGFQKRGGSGVARRGSAPAAQQGGFDLERIAALNEAQYAAWKRALSPEQRKGYMAALGG